jgi:putative metallohydrolase (TIGR04338 family)
LVADGRGRRHACGSRQVIKLPRWARTRPVVLHECAHGLADDQHGPRFVARYVDLLERFLGLDRSDLHLSLARHRVRIAIADSLPAASRRAAARRS